MFIYLITKIKSKDVTWKESLAICKTVRVDEDVNVNKAEYYASKYYES